MSILAETPESATPDDFHPLSGKDAEDFWHERFAEYRVHGEWFELPDFAIQEFVNAKEGAA